MKIVDMKIENFLAIKEAELKLWEKGLVLIQGENIDDPSADSNGSGKSTIPDALCWALYGKTARGVSGDGVVNLQARKGCRVSVTIKEENQFYRVSRHRKHPDKKNSLTVDVCETVAGVTSTTDLTKGTDKLTQEIVNELIGCSHDVFVGAVYAGQESMPDLPAMTDKYLKLLVEESAGIDRLQAAYEIAKNRSSKSQQRLRDANSVLQGLKTALDAAKSAATAAVTNNQNFEAKRAVRVQAAEDAVKKYVTLYNVKSAAALDNLIEIDRIKSQINKLQVSIDGTKQEEIDLKNLEATFELSKERLSKKKFELSSAANEMKGVMGEIRRVENKVGTECGECGKEYHAEDIALAKETAQRRLSETSPKVQRLKSEYEGLVQAAESASKRLSQFKSSMTDLRQIIADKSAQESEKQSLESAVKEVNEMKKRLDNLKTDVGKIISEANPFTSLVREQQSLVSKYKGDIKKQEKKISAKEDEANIAKAAADVFGPAGVRAHVLDTVTPFLNQQTAKYLGTLSDGNISAIWSTLTRKKNGDLSEKFSIQVKNDKGANSFAGLSGGEKRKVRLATAMALQDLVASRATKPIDLFMADEVDHALDEAGLERLMSILDEKAKERGTVLVISHNSLSDWIREQATVIKENGISRVEGVLNGTNQN